MWEAPPSEHHNGEIREYRVNVTEVETGSMLQYSTEDTEITITGLHPYYRYVCTVTAVTVSEGPYSANVTVRTHEAGTYKSLSLSLSLLKLDEICRKGTYVVPSR